MSISVCVFDSLGIGILMSLALGQNLLPNGRVQVRICSLIGFSIVVQRWSVAFQWLSNGDQSRHQQHHRPLIMSSGIVTRYVILWPNDWHIFRWINFVVTDLLRLIIIAYVVANENQWKKHWQWPQLLFFYRAPPIETGTIVLAHTCIL